MCGRARFRWAYDPVVEDESRCRVEPQSALCQVPVGPTRAQAHAGKTIPRHQTHPDRSNCNVQPHNSPPMYRQCVVAVFPKLAALLYFSINVTVSYDVSIRHALEAQTSNGKWATPQQIADTVLFLSSGLSDHLCGEVIAVDGGWLAGTPVQVG